MEINYDLIIKYLGGKKVVDSHSKPFLTQKNIFNHSINFPEKFKILLADKFYRYGITQSDNENNNISFWSSLLTLLDKNFTIPLVVDELELINQFKNQLIDKFNKSSFNKKIDKEDLRSRIKSEPDNLILEYLVEILDINIIVFDFKSMDIYATYHGNSMNPWKQILLMGKFNKDWEPIMMIKNKGDVERLFDYNNPAIKKLLFSDNLILCWPSELIPNKKFHSNTDIEYILECEKNKLFKTNIKNKKQLEPNTLTTQTTQTLMDILQELKSTDKLNKTRMGKYKVEELMQIYLDLGLEQQSNKKLTKVFIIEEIIKKLS
jgi:hypothetical protein